MPQLGDTIDIQKGTKVNGEEFPYHGTWTCVAQVFNDQVFTNPSQPRVELKCDKRGMFRVLRPYKPKPRKDGKPRKPKRYKAKRIVYQNLRLALPANPSYDPKGWRVVMKEDFPEDAEFEVTKVTQQEDRTIVSGYLTIEAQPIEGVELSFLSEFARRRFYNIVEA